ncbi:MAG: Ig-like domain-containing protein, partial [Pirellulales bacterium]
MKNAAQKTKKTKPATKKNRGAKASLQMESLEIRDLLVGNALDFVDNLSVTTPGPPAIMTLDFEPTSGPGIFGIRIEGKSGDFDPSSPFMYHKDTPTTHITPLKTVENVGGTTDSLIIFEAGPADLTIEVGGTGSGDFLASLFVVGDDDGDGVVTEDEKMKMVAAELQGRGAGNFNTAEYFRLVYGINFNEDQYDANGDADGNGKIDAYELGYVTTNTGGPAIDVDLIGDNNPPAANAAVVTDTGLSTTDNIAKPPATTTEAAISGTITDFSIITGAVLSLDGTGGNTIDLLNSPGNPSITVTDNQITFSLSIDDLDNLLGIGSIVDSGSHTLNFIGLDEIGNATTAPGEVISFTFDNDAPDQPDAPVMDSNDDTGLEDDDAITQNGGPLFISSGHGVGSSVVFFNGANSFGSPVIADALGVAKLNLTPGFTNGSGLITVIETDIAGNESSESNPLDFRIDSLDPATVAIDLDNNLSGFDHLTEETKADFEGTIGPDAFESDYLISLQDENGVEIANTTSTTGAFSFTGIALNEGHNDFQFVATDLAGNTSLLEFDVTRNLEPEIDVPAPGVINFNETTADAISSSIGTLLLDPTTEDSTENLTYEFLSSTAYNSGNGMVPLSILVEFAINNDGELSLVADPDQELNFEGAGAIAKIDFEIKVTDDLGDGEGGDLSDTVTVTVALNDIDDRPEVVGTPGPFSVDELDDTGINIVNGEEIAGAQMDQFFTDADASPNLEYSIMAGDLNEAFSIDSVDGQIKIEDINELNFETTPTYTLTIKATDTGSADPATESKTVDVVINLNDINEAPVATGDPFTLTPTFGELIGNSIEIPGQSVIAAGFEDPDNADNLNVQTLTYTTNDDRFVFVGNVLQTATDLTATTLDFDFEDPANFNLPSHGISFEVTANDGNVGGITVAVVNVQVTDQNDAPVFDAGSYSFDFDEDKTSLTGGTPTVSATDQDMDIVTFTAYDSTGKAEDTRFSFTGGVLSLTGKIDFEDPSQFDDPMNHTIDLVLMADDGNGDSHQVNATVTIAGVNEAPVITQTEYQVAEVTVTDNDDPVATIQFTDPEFPGQGDIISFLEVGGDGASFFKVSSAGVITVEAGPVPHKAYTYQVEGKDLAGASTGTVTLNIDVVENLPPELVEDTFAVDENNTSIVFVLEATDIHPMSPTVEDNVPFDWSIPGGHSIFELVEDPSDTVERRTRHLVVQSGKELDFEANAGQITFDIEIGDAIGSKQLQTVTININDLNESPVYGAQAVPAIDEYKVHGPGETDADLDNPGFESTPYSFDLNSLFTDDDNDAMSYSIVDPSVAGAFKVDGTNLVVDDTTLFNADSLPATITFKIEADDQDGKANSKTVSDLITVTVNERNELPDLNALDMVAGPVGTFEAYLQDVDQVGDVGDVVGNLFTIPALSGLVDPEGDSLVTLDETAPSSDYFSIKSNGDIEVTKALVIAGSSEDFTLKFSISDDNGSPLNSSDDLGYSDF